MRCGAATGACGGGVQRDPRPSQWPPFPPESTPLAHTTRMSETQIQVLLKAMAGTTIADAERLCLDVRRLSALAGSSQLRDADLHDVVDRSRYRRDVLKQAQSGGGAPTIDREADRK